MEAVTKTEFDDEEPTQTNQKPVEDPQAIALRLAYEHAALPQDERNGISGVQLRHTIIALVGRFVDGRTLLPAAVLKVLRKDNNTPGTGGQ